MDPELSTVVLIASNTQDNMLSSLDSNKPSDQDQIPLQRKSVEEDDEDEEDDDDDDDIASKVKTFLVAIELIVFVIATGLLICSLTVPKLQNSFIGDIKFWKWCVLALAILSGRLASQWLIKVVVFFIEKNFMLKHFLLYFIYALRTSVGVFIWFIFILLTWFLLFDHQERVKRSKDTSKILHYITRTLVSCAIAAALWVAKNLTVKLIGVSFQCKQFFDPIKESFFHQFVLKTLSTAKTDQEQKGKTAEGGVRFLNRILRRFSFGRENYGAVKKKIDAEKVNKTSKEKVSAWTLKDLINNLTDQSKKSSRKSEEVDERDYDEIKSESEAEHFADRIFADVAAEPQRE